MGCRVKPGHDETVPVELPPARASVNGIKFSSGEVRASLSPRAAARGESSKQMRSRAARRTLVIARSAATKQSRTSRLAGRWTKMDCFAMIIVMTLVSGCGRLVEG
jgi:hypothetical protein